MGSQVPVQRCPQLYPHHCKCPPAIQDQITVHLVPDTRLSRAHSTPTATYDSESPNPSRAIRPVPSICKNGDPFFEEHMPAETEKADMPANGQAQDTRVRNTPISLSGEGQLGQMSTADSCSSSPPREAPCQLACCTKTTVRRPS